MEAHVVIVVGDAEVMHIVGKDAQVYEEEHQRCHGEHHAWWKEEHSYAVTPPHPGGSVDSSQTRELAQTSAAQKSSRTLRTEGSPSGTAVGFQNQEDTGRDKILEPRLIPTNTRAFHGWLGSL